MPTLLLTFGPAVGRYFRPDRMTPAWDHPAATRPDPGLPTFAGRIAESGQRMVAAIVCAIAVVMTLLVLPLAGEGLPPMPAFVASSQTALIVVSAISSYLLFAQVSRTQSKALLILAAGSLYATLIAVVQCLSFSDVFGAERILGTGPETTTWLWVFWHLGPPLFALAYAMAVGETPRCAGRMEATGRIGPLVALATLCGVGFLTLVVTNDVAFLPKVVEGDDYSRLMSTGTGAAIVFLTGMALAVHCARTRLRTVLHLWLAVAFVLLLSDDMITLIGGMRGSVGWFVGRLEALGAGVIILVVYLREMEFLQSRAEAAAMLRGLERADLQQARDNLAIALEAAEMGDWDLDLATDNARRSLKHDLIFGYDSLQPRWGMAELLAHVWPEDFETVESAFNRGAATGAFEAEFRIKRAGDHATRWIAYRNKTYFGVTGAAVRIAGVVMDTTDRRDAENRVKQSQKMEAIGQLTGGVAHDFNNLLTIIVGNLDLILRRPDDASRVHRLAGSSLVAARHGADVTQKLLTFSRHQMLRPETVDLNALLQDFGELLGGAVGATIAIKLDLDPGLHPVSLDPGQFESALLNMAVNARDAMPDGGRITVMTRNAVVGALEATRAPDLAPGDYVVVAMSDCGIGMDARTLASAFDPFFTTKDPGKGSGLGLSQVYGFAKQAGGQVRIESDVARGTTVRLFLPRSLERVVDRGERAPVIPLRRARAGEVVLVVEDEAGVLDVAVESLKDLGYATRTATDAAAALQHLRGPDRIDILFSDVVMPGGMDGAELSIEARRLRPDLRILLASGRSDAALDELPQDVPLLMKPYLRTDLAERLGGMMAG